MVKEKWNIDDLFLRNLAIQDSVECLNVTTVSDNNIMYLSTCNCPSPCGCPNQCCCPRQTK